MFKCVEKLKGQFAAVWVALAVAFALCVAPVLGGCAGDNGTAANDGTQPAAEEQHGDPSQAPVNDGADANKITVNVAVMSATDEGAALFQEDMAVDAGTTALAALQATGLDVKVEDSQYGPYVTAIGDTVAEGNSGWTYTVNGESPTVSANETVLNEGDQLVWQFVTF